MHLKTTITRQRKPSRIGAYLYRIPMPVGKVVVFSSGDSYPVCPRCDCTIDREYMRFCDRCGQRLSWMRLDAAKIVTAEYSKP